MIVVYDSEDLCTRLLSKNLFEILRYKRNFVYKHILNVAIIAISFLQHFECICEQNFVRNAKFQTNSLLNSFR